mgnify:CR=1 FL=1
MTAIRPQGLEGFLRKPDPAVGILLIYGDEPAAIRDLAARAVKQVAGSLDDPFTVVRLDDGALAADPARLADEMQSISMFGGRRAIWVREAGEAFLRAAEPVLDGRASGNLIVAEAGALAKSSALRNALEQSPRALILPVYEASIDARYLPTRGFIGLMNAIGLEPAGDAFRYHAADVDLVPPDRLGGSGEVPQYGGSGTQGQGPWSGW